MLFNSIEFLVFFPIVTLLYFVFPTKLRNYWLLIASYFFYMCWNPKYILLLMTSTIITYSSGLVLEYIKNKEKEDSKKTFFMNCTVAASFVLNIGMLFYYKYINFALEIITNIAEAMHISYTPRTFDIILPVGISFYIFQALNYTMDVYRDEIYAEKNIFRYALFVSFFPQLVAGPIERSKNLLHQLATPNSFNYENARTGLLTMLWGYFIKIVIADRAAICVDHVYDSLVDYHGMSLIIVAFVFSVQIYCDFMGYSIIAKGAARVLGYNLMDNFNMPYFSKSIKEFWRRWHISLSSWLRDYLYIPLGGNKKGTIRKNINVMITFLVSGLWHGANMTFVIWGAMHGIAQVCEDIFKCIFGCVSNKLGNKYARAIWDKLLLLKTFILVSIGWVFFRADTLKQAIEYLKAALKIDNVREVLFNGGLLNLGLDIFEIRILIIAIIVLWLASFIRERGNDLVAWISTKNVIIRYPIYWGIVTLIILSLDITGKEFIYFQF